MSAAASNFNPPSRDVADYTGGVFYKKDLKVGKYYGIGMHDRADTIVKVVKVTPVAGGYGQLARHGAAAIEAKEESGSVLDSRTLFAYKFFEYRMKPSEISIPDSMEPNEPLNAAGRAEHNRTLREYQEEEATRRSSALYSRRRRGGKRRSTRRRSTRRRSTKH